MNQFIEKEREIAREKRRVSMARLCASQTQEQKEAARETVWLAMRNHRAHRKDNLRDVRRNASMKYFIKRNAQ